MYFFTIFQRIKKFDFYFSNFVDASILLSLGNSGPNLKREGG